MLVGLRIVFGVVVFRLKKLEMANLAAALAIALALRLGFVDVAVRLAFAFALNIVVYLNNDYIDVELDLASTNKDTSKSSYLAEHLRAAFWAQVVLVALLSAGAFVYDAGLLFPIIVGGGICWWYSAILKRRPFWDIVAMMIWGLAMPMCGSPVERTLGWCLAAQLGLFSGVFESIQVMRDAEADAEEADVRTTGVVLGVRRTLMLARALMIVCSVYAALVMNPIAAAVSVGALLVPFTANDIAKYWTRVKLAYGVTWLIVCGFVFLQQRSSGLVWAIDAAAILR
ncbi:MAG TPA: UbiA family prenyltransferase [Polyangiaceae bacterium]|jgi:4-hydroxybenzoate polyprenyltransferase|nr:UbiA family prenyltransferase [Polyangiaceae bacterium]